MFVYHCTIITIITNDYVQYKICSVWFLDIRIYQLVYIVFDGVILFWLLIHYNTWHVVRISDDFKAK